MPTVESRVREILAAEYGADEIGVNETLTDLGLDSLDCTEFFMTVEEEWKLPEISEAEQDSMTTVQQVVAYVESRRLVKS